MGGVLYHFNARGEEEVFRPSAKRYVAEKQGDEAYGWMQRDPESELNLAISLINNAEMAIGRRYDEPERRELLAQYQSARWLLIKAAKKIERIGSVNWREIPNEVGMLERLVENRLMMLAKGTKGTETLEHKAAGQATYSAQPTYGR